jgi:hypothetical protein
MRCPIRIVVLLSLSIWKQQYRLFCVVSQEFLLPRLLTFDHAHRILLVIHTTQRWPCACVVPPVACAYGDPRGRPGSLALKVGRHRVWARALPAAGYTRHAGPMDGACSSPAEGHRAMGTCCAPPTVAPTTAQARPRPPSPPGLPLAEQ